SDPEPEPAENLTPVVEKRQRGRPKKSGGPLPGAGAGADVATADTEKGRPELGTDVARNNSGSDHREPSTSAPKDSETPAVEPPAVEKPRRGRPRKNSGGPQPPPGSGAAAKSMDP